MAFKDVLKEKVPAYLQETPEFPIIMKMISTAKITGAESLRHWLNVEIEKHNNDLKEFNQAGSTANRKRVRCADEIKLLNLVKNKILLYVK